MVSDNIINGTTASLLKIKSPSLSKIKSRGYHHPHTRMGSIALAPSPTVSTPILEEIYIRKKHVKRTAQQSGRTRRIGTVLLVCVGSIGRRLMGYLVDCPHPFIGHIFHLPSDHLVLHIPIRVGKVH